MERQETKEEYKARIKREKQEEHWRNDVRAALQVSIDWAKVQDRLIYQKLQDMDRKVDETKARLEVYKVEQERLREDLHRNRTMAEAALAMAREAGVDDLQPSGNAERVVSMLTA